MGVCSSLEDVCAHVCGGNRWRCVMCGHVSVHTHWSMCTSTCDVATCVCASVRCVHIHMLHAVKTSVCGVCHYRQPCVYNSVHESHEAHTPHNAVTASMSVRPWCVGDGDASRARISPSKRHAHPRLVCACMHVGCLRRFNLSVDSCVARTHVGV